MDLVRYNSENPCIEVPVENFSIPDRKRFLIVEIVDDEAWESFLAEVTKKPILKNFFFRSI